MARRKRKADSEETTYWLSYSDMMAALLLVFILIITLTMLQARKQFDEKQRQLDAQQEQIEAAVAAAKEAEELAKAAQEEAEKARDRANEQEAIIKEQQEKLDKIIGVRQELVEALKKEFDGTNLSVSVDEKTGAITLDSSILFDVDQYAIKAGGKTFLNDFLPRYVGVLLNDNFSEYVSEIIIEGHTDTNGSYMHNLELSQDRALSVATFCLQDGSKIFGNKVDLTRIRSIITANGRSYSDPKKNPDGSIDMDGSRRVEFKFRLKDEEMVEEMNSILSNE